MPWQSALTYTAPALAYIALLTGQTSEGARGVDASPVRAGTRVTAFVDIYFTLPCCWPCAEIIAGTGKFQSPTQISVLIGLMENPCCWFKNHTPETLPILVQTFNLVPADRIQTGTRTMALQHKAQWSLGGKKGASVFPRDEPPK